MSEEWRPIPGFPSYEASSEGNVRRVGRRVLRAHPRFNGYMQVSLSEQGVVYPKKVHQLVAAAFIGPRPDGADTCHENGVRDDNRSCNLRYDTRSANLADRAKHGRPHSGENVGTAVLTEAQVIEILQTHPGAGTYGANASIAKLYGVSAKTISDIILGRSWTHITRGTTDE